MEVQLFDRADWVPIPAQDESTQHAEDVVHHLCKNRINCRPTTLTLFALYSLRTKTYVPPQHKIHTGPHAQEKYQLRLRYKLPLSSKLQTLDKQAFLYFYHQIRHDYSEGILKLPKPWQDEHGSKKSKWWYPPLLEATDPETRDKKVQLYIQVLKLSCLNMCIDAIETNKTAREVSGKIYKYFPEGFYSNGAEKVVNSAKLRGTAEGIIQKWMDKNMTPTRLRQEFLDETESYFPHYFEETFTADFVTNASKLQHVKLIFKPPFKETKPENNFKEHETSLEMAPFKGKRVDTDLQTRLCTIEEICNISLGQDDNIEISRQNGIPLYLKIKSKSEMNSFLSLLSGYYRLCEKWTFSLCNQVVSPSLQTLLRSSVHGPVPLDFVEKKFIEKSKRQKGDYILRMCTDHHDLIYLHYLPEDGARPECLHIRRSPTGLFRLNVLDGGGDLGQEFTTLQDLIKFLKQPDNAYGIYLRSCLHPSEYDKEPMLLLCRAISQLEADILGSRPSSLRAPVLIPFSALSRYENKRFPGRLINVWKGQWYKSRNEKVQVAIKQLKEEFATTRLQEFLYMVNKVMTWNDSSLVEIIGTPLTAPGSPAAIILEYFPLGPLDIYLQKNRSDIELVDLVEAATSLAGALWYLDQEKIVHGNIRCKRVFVSRHNERSFKIKLGDPGIPEYTLEDVHWLPLEMLLENGVCNKYGDVWAYATTLWEVFSYGAKPCQVNPSAARQQYINGDRLSKPPAITGQVAQVYEVMRECWNPNPSQRKEPQAIMRDMNQLLYRVFNSRKVHTYVTIDDSSPTDSVDTLTTVGESQNANDTIETLLSESPKPMMVPQQETVESPVPSLRSSAPSMTSSTNGSVSEYGPPTPMLIPTFNDMMKRFSDQCSIGNLFNKDNSSSTDRLLDFSRPGSSLAGSLFNTDMSNMTSQTSLDSLSLYSMSSIYQITNESQLELNTEFPLGEGNFGVVFKGVLTKSNGEWEQVAVKMLKDKTDMGSEAECEMEKELEIMKNLNHENTVRIKGIFNDDKKTIIVMEYVKEGSLDRYLHVQRQNIAYPKQLFIYAQNIVEGMMYLQRKGIIHRDLAARNILVENEELVKISDFGLARTTESDFYVMQTNTNIPIKWMAVECLTRNLYSFASDVWSFGVTLWEMFSFGAPPHLTGCQGFFKASDPEAKQRRDFQTWMQMLEDGVRLPIPDNCSATLYTEVMLPCWDKEPRNRPGFHELGMILSRVELQVT